MGKTRDEGFFPRYDFRFPFFFFRRLLVFVLTRMQIVEFGARAWFLYWISTKWISVCARKNQ